MLRRGVAAGAVARQPGLAARPHRLGEEILLLERQDDVELRGRAAAPPRRRGCRRRRRARRRRSRPASSAMIALDLGRQPRLGLAVGGEHMAAEMRTRGGASGASRWRARHRPCRDAPRSSPAGARCSNARHNRGSRARARRRALGDLAGAAEDHQRLGAGGGAVIVGRRLDRGIVEQRLGELPRSRLVCRRAGPGSRR